MRIRSALFGLMMATATASCAFLLDFDQLQAGGGIDGGAGAAGATSVPLDQLATSYADALCTRIDRCVGAVSPVIFGEEDCRDYLSKTLGQSTFAGLEALPAEKFEYHGEKVPACLDAVRNADCDVLFAFPLACEEAINGLVTQGGDCTHPAECSRGLYCSVPTGNCPGTCQPKPAEGETCANGACLEGLQCDDVSQKCVTPAGSGQPCEGGSKPRCRLDMTCMSKDATTPGTCRENDTLYTLGTGLGCNWTKGGLCEKGQFCALESVVKVQAGDFSGTCVGETAGNDPCTLSLPDSCAPGFYCRVTVGIGGNCTPLPTPGEPCALNALKGLCVKGSRCLGRDESNPALTPGTCTAIAGLTYGCPESEACYSGHCENGTCAPPNYCFQ
jgi:hypothetical protein